MTHAEHRFAGLVYELACGVRSGRYWPPPWWLLMLRDKASADGLHDVEYVLTALICDVAQPPHLRN